MSFAKFAKNKLDMLDLTIFFFVAGSACGEEYSLLFRWGKLFTLHLLKSQGGCCPLR
jgi:hypothetical protein